MSRYVTLVGEWDEEIKVGLKEALILIEITNPFSKKDLTDTLAGTRVEFREIFMSVDECIMDELNVTKYKGYPHSHLWTERIELHSLDEIILPINEIKKEIGGKMTRYVVITGSVGHTKSVEEAEALIKSKNLTSEKDLLNAFEDTGIFVSEIYMDLAEAQVKELEYRKESGLYSSWARIVELPLLEDIILPKEIEKEPLYIRQSDVIDFINELEKYGISLGYAEADGKKENFGLHVLMPGLMGEQKSIKLYSRSFFAVLGHDVGHAEVSPEIWGDEELTDEEFDSVLDAGRDDSL